MVLRPFCGMAAAFILGILTAVSGSKWLFAAAMGMLAIMLAVCVKQHIYRRGPGPCCGETLFRGMRGAVLVRRLLIALMFLLGWQRCQVQQEFKAAYLPYLETGMRLEVKGELSSKEFKNNQYIYNLTSCKIGLYQKEMSKKTTVPCNRIMVYPDSDDFSIGETLILNGTVELWRKAVNEGNFDERAFYEAQKTDFKLKDISITESDGKPDAFREWLYQLRLQLRSVYETVMGQKDGGVMSTMALGDKSLLDAEIKRLYQTAGLSHILAISGLHISVIGMSVYRLCRRMRMGFWSAGVTAGGLMVCYGIMVGMGTSVYRAILMFILALFAKVIGRSYDSLNALGAAALLILWDNPFVVFYAGFLFSFAAVIGVVWIGKNIQEENKRRAHLLASIAIQLATLPFAAWYYYEIPVYAILINLIALPFVGVILSLGAAGGLVGLVSVKAAKVLLFPCHLILCGYQKICTFFAAVPGAMLITGRPVRWKMSVYYAALAAVTYGVHRCAEKHRCSDTIEKVQKSEDAKKPGGERKGTGFLSWGHIPVGILLLLFLFFTPRGGFELDILDVGQGDASFIRTADGDTIFVDGGSSDVKKSGEYRILPFLKSKGIKNVDYWFVSHTDSDHISGLREVIETGYPVDYLVFSREIAQDEAYLKLVQAAEQQGIQFLYLGMGDTLHLGDVKIRCIFPDRAQADKNAGSLVVRYEEDGFLGLFTGDIGIAEERKIIQLGVASGVDFYKAAHHGSKGSNSTEFLELLHPAVSSISCALKNSYGHPGKEAVDRMEAAGSTLFYTMSGGQIKITREEGELIVQKYTDPLDVSRFPVVE